MAHLSFLQKKTIEIKNVKLVHFELYCNIVTIALTLRFYKKKDILWSDLWFESVLIFIKIFY